MSERHAISFSHEELDELANLLESLLKSTMVEVRRSTPNSEFKHYMSRRVDLIKTMLGSIQEVNATHPVAAGSH